jgi:signal transduction histidine kinase
MLDAVPHERFFDEIKQYVGFDEADSALLREFLPFAEPNFPRISQHFYDAILEHPSAHAAITGGTEQVERLKGTLVEWMRSGLTGPHDQAFYERRCRIGRMHVKIKLPQQFMFTAMNLMRVDFREVAFEWLREQPDKIAIHHAIDKLFDIELAIMLETFAEDSQHRLRAAERLATIGQLAASIGHDLRNPLGVIESSLFILRKRIEASPKADRHLTKISAQVENCNHIVTDLLELARDRPPKWADVDVAKAFKEAIDSIGVSPDVTFERDIPDGTKVRADPGLLRQVLANLITNAIIAFEGKPGTVYLSTRSGDATTILGVGDDGTGFSDEALVHAFEPLFTTRAKGTGLGLAMVQNVIERHGGQVRASNRPEGGALVEIELPAGTD